MLKIQLNLHIKETKKNGRKLEQKLIRLRSNNCLIKSLVSRTNQFRRVAKETSFYIQGGNRLNSVLHRKSQLSFFGDLSVESTHSQRRH
jgi:hypothetical protein